MSDRWQVVITREARRDMRRLPRNLLERLNREIQALASNPRPPGYRKLVEYDDIYRVRVGDWRIVYALENDRLVILVLEVKPRGAAYKGL